MDAIEIMTTNGDLTEVNMTDVEALTLLIRGKILLPNSNGYDDARQIWNAMIDRRPAIIIQCNGPADVVTSVNFARAHGLLVSVRGGGHNVAGNAVCDGGLMIDLSMMRNVHVNPDTQRARAGGGATWGDFDAETQLYGLATTGGLISSTGVGGLTLGGGIGWLSPSHGLACDNLISVEVVTANGEVVTASETQNSDLFWGLQGGSGNFGVATSLEFQLHPVGPIMFGGMVFYPLEVAEEVLAQFRDFMATAPDNLAAMAGIITPPDGTMVLALVAVYNGNIAEGEAALAPLRAFGTSSLDTFAPTPYRTIQTLFDAGAPSGRRYYFKSSFLNELSADAISTVCEYAQNCPSPYSKIFIEFMRGAFSRVPRDATVFDHRSSSYNLLVIGAWPDQEDDAENRDWTRDIWGAMQPYSSGRVYVNYLGTVEDEGSDRIMAAYGPGKYEKLLALKKKYDPENLFRMNQNIRPDVG